ncbi:helix-turn-helix transcriptional regulator [Agathobaculum sp. NTUH-O15-33]|uniref:helix-turn-helix domain-containing protein n=1 Tax=Agathobaculum sp. NTUH-O15-33 TaxID=3079302 RepID=UPI002958D00B|nr:helix-turn-helix transcriptional regulator [Agathobaculum sp. NTUH-O15-33]WNX85218.1 helix-turn-helix transcriptional regulator [Agathobaculum sp. NTUH-O15-33]
MSEYERIKEIRLHVNLSQAQFGKKIGVSRDVINNLERGRAELKDYMCKLICSEYQIDENWLRTGEGEMTAPLSKDEEFHQLLTEIEFSGDESVREMLQAYWNLEENEKAAIKRLISDLNKK